MAAKCLIVFADFVESSVAEPPGIAIKGRFVVGADFWSVRSRLDLFGKQNRKDNSLALFVISIQL